MNRLSLLLLCLIPGLAQAEFRIDYGEWRYDLSGQTTTGGNTYDFDRDLALKEVGRASAQLQWYTGKRKPDLIASYSEFGATGHNQRTVTILVPPSTQTVTYDTTGEFRDYDLTLRWPVAHGFALGFTVKQLDGEITIDDSSNPPPTHSNYSVTYPELHLGWRAPIGDWLTLGVSGQGAALGGNHAVEWRAAAEVKLWAVLLEAGYQVKRYKIEIDDYRLDARLGGALLRAGFAF